MLAEITRINHIKSLCKRKGWDRKTFVREAIYHAILSRPTAEKAYDGDTDLSMDTVERIARLFGVQKDEVLESKF